MGILRKGKREHKKVKDKLTKQHIKRFYSILEEMEDLSKKLNPDIEYNEENINNYVKPIYGRDLDSMEKFLILGKIHYKNEEDNNKGH